ncbi:MAG UNVERIFIED_CONTAM: hypothetical protein LVR29_24245 [Microcystis novacekii LVE1205-3]
MEKTQMLEQTRKLTQITPRKAIRFRNRCAAVRHRNFFTETDRQSND